jgi:hypothetical protein
MSPEDNEKRAAKRRKGGKERQKGDEAQRKNDDELYGELIDLIC